MATRSEALRLMDEMGGAKALAFTEAMSWPEVAAEVEHLQHHPEGAAVMSGGTSRALVINAVAFYGAVGYWVAHLWG
jgi:hypothetical protein